MFTRGYTRRDRQRDDVPTCSPAENDYFADFRARRLARSGHLQV